MQEDQHANMSSSVDFKRLKKPSSASKARGRRRKLGQKDFFADLSDLIAERFMRISGLAVVVAPVNWPGNPADESPPPLHPQCADCTDIETCREPWQTHLAELEHCPEVHWHRCDRNKMCAVVPVVAKGRCLAACKLVCPETMGESDFERNVELLDVLVENFVAREGDLLARMIPEGKAAPADEAASDDMPSARPTHPKVRRAIEHINQHLAEPTMTVANIARVLEMNSTYLAHLFSQQVGTRMSRYVAVRRMELAKKLLVDTDSKIKRVAYESGHANADWFSQVFHAHTGLTPREYRRRMRSS